ncbi:MAG: hypothetical protein AB7R40_25300 [Nitrospiraceae bacterium]
MSTHLYVEFSDDALSHAEELMDSLTMLHLAVQETQGRLCFNDEFRGIIALLARQGVSVLGKLRQHAAALRAATQGTVEDIDAGEEG